MPGSAIRAGRGGTGFPHACSSWEDSWMGVPSRPELPGTKRPEFRWIIGRQRSSATLGALVADRDLQFLRLFSLNSYFHF